MPRVSVIIPAYNYGRYLREAVESVQAQDVDDLELLVIDNGSTDNTQEVIAAIQDPRLRVFRLFPNRGLSVAVNVGLDNARGDYIAYLDADDRYRPGKLRKQLEVLQSEPDVGVAFCNFVRFDESGFFPQTQFEFFPELERLEVVPTRAGGGHRIVGDAFAALLGFMDPPAWLQMMLFRRSVLEGIRLVPGMRLCQDTLFCLRVFHRTQVAFTAEPLVEVRRHGENLTSRIADMTHAKVRVFEMLESEALTPEQHAALRRRLGHALISSGQTSLEERRPLRAASAFRRAIACQGARLRALKNLAALPAHPLLLQGLRK